MVFLIHFSNSLVVEFDVLLNKPRKKIQKISENIFNTILLVSKVFVFYTINNKESNNNTKSRHGLTTNIMETVETSIHDTGRYIPQGSPRGTSLQLYLEV